LADLARQADRTVGSEGSSQAGHADRAPETLETLEALSTDGTVRAGGSLSSGGAGDSDLALRAGLADDAEANVGSVEPADLDVVVGDSVTLGLDPETRSRKRAGLALVVRRPCDAYDHDHQTERAQQREPSL
jgi:hypothetical protein